MSANATTNHQSILIQPSLPIDTGSKNALSNFTPPIPDAAWVLIGQGDYAQAAKVLATAGRDLLVRNALGVCLLRTGNYAGAVSVFRSFVLWPGTTVERHDVSNESKRNFATALLLKGLPCGALSVLAAMQAPDHPMTVRLYASIKAWEKSMSWMSWLDWKTNGSEPRSCRFVIDFEPGEFDFDNNNPAEKLAEVAPAATSSLKLAA